MTIGAVIDRIYRDYLANPTDLPAQAGATALINNSQLTIVYNDELSFEEKDSIGPGTIVEINLERIRVTAHDEDTRTLTVTRGAYGSIPAAHAQGDLIIVSPRFPRLSVFDALADEIEALFPDLYAVGTEWASPNDTHVELLAADNPQEVLDARQLVGGEYVPIEARIINSDDFSSAVALEVVSRNTINDIWVRYTKDFSRPTAEADTLPSLGIEESWSRILIFGTLSYLMLGADVDLATQDFVTEALEAEGFPATTGTSLAVALDRLKATEVRRAAARQRARYHNGVMVDYRREL
jgi:hypothetical protein